MNRQSLANRRASVASRPTTSIDSSAVGPRRVAGAAPRLLRGEAQTVRVDAEVAQRVGHLVRRTASPPGNRSRDGRRRPRPRRARGWRSRRPAGLRPGRRPRDRAEPERPPRAGGGRGGSGTAARPTAQPHQRPSAPPGSRGCGRGATTLAVGQRLGHVHHGRQGRRPRARPRRRRRAWVASRRGRRATSAVTSKAPATIGARTYEDVPQRFEAAGQALEDIEDGRLDRGDVRRPSGRDRDDHRGDDDHGRCRSGAGAHDPRRRCRTPTSPSFGAPLRSRLVGLPCLRRTGPPLSPRGRRSRETTDPRDKAGPGCAHSGVTRPWTGYEGSR